MTADELGPESPESGGRRPTMNQVAETARFLLYIAVMVVGLSLLITFELYVRF